MSWDTRSLLELLDPPELPADGVLMSCDTRLLLELLELLDLLELLELLELPEFPELPELTVLNPSSARLLSTLVTQLGFS